MAKLMKTLVAGGIVAAAVAVIRGKKTGDGTADHDASPIKSVTEAARQRLNASQAATEAVDRAGRLAQTAKDKVGAAQRQAAARLSGDDEGESAGHGDGS